MGLLWFLSILKVEWLLSYKMITKVTVTCIFEKKIVFCIEQSLSLLYSSDILQGNTLVPGFL